MMINKASLHVIRQLNAFLHSLTDEEFNRPLSILNNHTIGEHVRHTLEFFICLKEGFFSGILNYDKRKHDKAIQQNRSLAISITEDLINFLAVKNADRILDFEVDYSDSGEETVLMTSTFFRELSYNIEHAVHHMAIIKIGINNMNPLMQLPPDFGVAVSTLRFNKVMSS